MEGRRADVGSGRQIAMWDFTGTEPRLGKPGPARWGKALAWTGAVAAWCARYGGVTGAQEEGLRPVAHAVEEATGETPELCAPGCARNRVFSAGARRLTFEGSY